MRQVLGCWQVAGVAGVAGVALWHCCMRLCVASAPAAEDAAVKNARALRAGATQTESVYVHITLGCTRCFHLVLTASASVPAAAAADAAAHVCVSAACPAVVPTG